MTADAKKIFGTPSCPVCKGSLTSFTISPPNLIDRFEISTRKYYGWCENCKCGCEVEQFLFNGQWFVYRWRKYNNRKRPKPGSWILVNDLPVPLLATGS